MNKAIQKLIFRSRVISTFVVWWGVRRYLNEVSSHLHRPAGTAVRLPFRRLSVAVLECVFSSPLQYAIRWHPVWMLRHIWSACGPIPAGRRVDWVAVDLAKGSEPYFRHPMPNTVFRGACGDASTLEKSRCRCRPESSKSGSVASTYPGHSLQSDPFGSGYPV